MTFYEELVIQTQRNYEQYYGVYARGGVPYELADPSPLSYDEQIDLFARKVQDADCILVGGASGLSAAGGGDFYYENNDSYKKYFGKYAEKYGFNGAFDGMFRQWDDRGEFWGYLATFLNTTQSAPIRAPYHDLAAILEGRDFHIVTTNQDTQFVKAFPEKKVAEIQGDHRFFQCSRCCTDYLWDAVGPVKQMIEAMGDGTAVPEDMIPRCPHCGAEAFPWVRGYGNLLQGQRYEAEYEKVSRYVQENAGRRMLFIELGVGRLTPMFIQEPFWNLTLGLPDAFYIAVNDKYDFLPKQLADKGSVIVADIAQVLRDVRKRMGR